MHSLLGLLNNIENNINNKASIYWHGRILYLQACFLNDSFTLEAAEACIDNATDLASTSMSANAIHEAAANFKNEGRSGTPHIYLHVTDGISDEER